MSKSARVLGRSQPRPAKSTGQADSKSRKGSQRQPIFRSADWITQADAARMRRVTRQAIAKLVRKGKFSLLTIAGRVFLKRTDVERYKPLDAGRPRSR